MTAFHPTPLLTDTQREGREEERRAQKRKGKVCGELRGGHFLNLGRVSGGSSTLTESRCQAVSPSLVFRTDILVRPASGTGCEHSERGLSLLSRQGLPQPLPSAWRLNPQEGGSFVNLAPISPLSEW